MGQIGFVSRFLVVGRIPAPGFVDSRFRGNDKTGIGFVSCFWLLACGFWLLAGGDWVRFE